MLNLLLNIITFSHLRQWFKKHKKNEPVVVWKFTNVDLKSDLKTKKIEQEEVLIYEKGRRKFCAVRCPKCNLHNIELNLVDNPYFQHWTISGPKNFTVHPSINYKTNECTAHYWIRDGKVIWT